MTDTALLDHVIEHLNFLLNNSYNGTLDIATWDQWLKVDDVADMLDLVEYQRESK